MADVIEPRILRGFRDYLPDVMAPRDRMVAVITDVFHRFGFAPLATPCLEYADILLGKYGEDAEMLLYRFTDNGGRDVCLRYDLTVPLARVVAQYPDLPRPFKRYQIAPVWRAEKPGKGRFREFVQCDVDIVGADGLAADAECIQVDHAVMTALGVKDFHIRLNHRKVLNGLGDFLDADAATMRGVLRTVDKLDKIGLDAVHDILVSENHLSADRADRLVSFLCIQGDNAERLARAAEVLTGVERAQQGLAELRAVLDLSEAGGVPAERLVADLSVARGLDYYTGAVFETTLDALPAVGSVMSGGRYDELISIFTGKNMPAVGISVGLDRLLAALQELGVVQAAVGVAQVFVTVFDAASRPASTGLAAGLRAAGFNVELSLADDKLGRQFKQADRLGARAALVLGPDEQASGVVTLKDLKTAQQETVAADRLIERLRAVLQ